LTLFCSETADEVESERVGERAGERVGERVGERSMLLATDSLFMFYFSKKNKNKK
jgi:hypothetical protein